MHVTSLQHNARHRTSHHWVRRHQWYQLQNKVTVDVYAKGLAPTQVQVSFEPQHLAIVIRDPQGEEEYRLETDLYSKVGGCWVEG